MANELARKHLEPGTVLGHFKLSEAIAVGGMGLVYRAVDERLDRSVAVKILSPELFRNEKAKARFIREAKFAAIIAHPNVAIVHEIDEQDGVPFIAMELVPGSNLKDMVCHRPLPLPEVISIGKQVCDALEAAHGHGVIHRDIKSSNVMVTPAGRVKVLDFGLAKALEEPAEEQTRERGSPETATVDGTHLITGQGVVLGTPSYMSPEQASGKPVDSRTDIFSLGVVLYEAASGELPFRGRTDGELLEAIRSKDPTPLHVDVGKVHRAFTQVISNCLSKEPERRYASAVALKEDLERLEKKAGLKHHIVRPLTQSWAGRLGLVGAFVLLLAVLVRPPSAWYEGGESLPSGTELVLADLDNQTGDARFDSVQTLLEVQLRQSPRLSIMSRSDMRDSLRKMVVPEDKSIDLDLARNIAWRQQSPIVVGPSLLKVGSQFVLAVRMDRIGESPSPEAVWSRSFRATIEDQLYDAVDQASYWIRRKIGEATEELERLNTPARDATTSSWEALDLFVRAEESQYSGRGDEARALLKEALVLDPDFALAWGRLADISYATDQELIYTYHRRALDAMKRRNLAKNEELRIRAVFAHDSQNYPDALRYFRAFAMTYPRDFVALTGYGYSLTDVGRYEEALRMLQLAEPFRPHAFTTFLNSSRVSLALGRIEEVRGYIEHMMDLGLDEAAFFVQGQLQYVLGEYQQSSEFFIRLIQSGNPYWEQRGVAQLSELLVERGRWHEAESVLREAIDKNIEVGRASDAADNTLALAQIHFERGEREACKNACLEAIEHERGAERLQRAGSLLGEAGFCEEAGQIHDAVPEQQGVTIYDRARHHIRGEVLLYEGDLLRAMEELEKARSLDAPAHQNEYLARAFLASGKVDDARAIYRRIAESLPALLWHNCLRRQPGLWAKALFHYAELSFELHEISEARRALERYLALRDEADEEIEEVRRARELLDQIDAQPET